ncbi:MAG: nicotinate (nicotinamide) nucleotide adenylyltransferase [Chloroflexi bacterium]|nr:nicotinate (nicotinamide) nucleotide adenylyltransferase [Chloroflexota bacterium]MQC48420.1 nicotinate (nicotinamide) nucleotide adenylyltransferase [Chloroflexota bacterium]
MGGTFDPPHHAHLALAAAAHTELLLDRVIFVPAGDPWRKRDRDVAPAGARLEMVLAATAPFNWAEVSSVDVDRAGPSYTADTLDFLVGPDEDWWFVLGADALGDMARWHEPARIVERARIAVARRPDYDAPLVSDELRELVPDIERSIDVLDMPLMEISATEIRRRVRERESTEFLIPPAVHAVIERLGLYRD